MLLGRLERHTEWPLTILAIALTVIIVIPHGMAVAPGTRQSLEMIDNLIWGLFVADIVVKLSIATDRRSYLQRHWFDVVLVAIPFLRPLRLVRSVRALRLLSLGRAVSAANRAVIVARIMLRRRGMHDVLLTAMIVEFLAASLMTAFERQHAGATIRSLPDGLWWAVATVTTVGYGDTYPVTGAGRGIGVALMLLGIALYGAITAHLAALFVESQDDDAAQRIADLTDRISDLEALIRSQHDRT